METATLTSPQRKSFMVQPVQKSLSLPSYARASGEGIDHRLIFAALEQKEKVRRKSKIFRDKEKCGTTRQNYFCLPLSSSAKCRETSLSSDTSCSSLEFQKPKRITTPSKNKKDNVNMSDRNDQKSNVSSQLSEQPIANDVDNEKTSLEKESPRKELCVPEVSRSAICSSDSMERTERSSRSSTDSLSRRERIVAMKARVEAEREKYGESSSEEETSLRITRYNSDGLIHRTVREVKAKSSRSEKRIRRKSQDESVMKRATRKQHTSLYLAPVTDLDSWKPPMVRSGSSYPLNKDVDENSRDILLSDYKKECSSLFGFSKESYFSDICGVDKSHFVQRRIKNIEAEELKHKLNLFSHELDKNSNVLKSSSPQCNETSNVLKEKNLKINLDSEVKNSLDSARKCASPYSRAPTPPPRSPKSMTFINKAFIQHQNATASNLVQEPHSLERRRNFFRPNITAITNNESGQHARPYEDKYPEQKQPNSFDIALLNRRNNDLIDSRRRTCGNFSHVGDITIERSRTPTILPSYKFGSQDYQPISPNVTPLLSHPSSTETSVSCSNTSVPSKFIFPGESVSESSKDKWERFKRSSDTKFNSLENKPKGNVPSWMKWRCLPKRKQPCSCPLIPGNILNCLCNQSEKYQFENNLGYSDKYQNISKLNNVNIVKSEIPIQPTGTLSNATSPLSVYLGPSKRLSKSEANLSMQSELKIPSPETKTKILLLGKDQSKVGEKRCNLPMVQSKVYYNTQINNKEELSATENLDTAMEELESVYQSLRISYENLSEKNSIKDSLRNGNDSNVCNVNGSDKTLSYRIQTKLSSIGRNELLPESPRNSLDELLRLGEEIRPNISIGEPKVLSSGNDKNEQGASICQSLCIEELFSDLTQQLDLEQKLLQTSKIKKPPFNSDQKSAFSETVPHQLPPNICIKSKKIIENPEKSSPDVTCVSIFTTKELKDNTTLSNIQQRALARKKHKAIRSLSANLSHLMKSTGVDIAPISDTTSGNEKTKNGEDTCLLEEKPVNTIHNNSIRTVEHAKTSLSSDNKKESISDQCLHMSNGDELKQTDRQQQPSDEIWEVRVSMDSGNRPTGSTTTAKEDNARTYSRLHSALSHRRVDGISKANLSLSEDRVNHSSVTATPALGKPASVVPLDESELEKLLTTLLSDVSKVPPSQKNSTSQLLRGLTEIQPSNVLSKGEMLVMQHLDVIRCQPDPS